MKRIIIGLALALIFTVAATFVVDKVYAAPNSGIVTHSNVHPRHPAGDYDHQVTWGHKMHRHFIHRLLGQSRGRDIPKKVIHAMGHYRQNHPDMTVPNWWKDHVLKTSSCVWNGVYFPGDAVTDTAFCLRYGDNPTVSKIERNITKVRVICAGAAAVAMYGGNAVVAFGTGVAACVYQGYANKVMKWLY